MRWAIYVQYDDELLWENWVARASGEHGIQLVAFGYTRDEAIDKVKEMIKKFSYFTYDWPES